MNLRRTTALGVAIAIVLGVALTGWGVARGDDTTEERASALTGTLPRAATHWARLAKSPIFKNWASDRPSTARLVESYWRSGGKKPSLRPPLGRFLVELAEDLRFAAADQAGVSVVPETPPRHWTRLARSPDYQAWAEANAAEAPAVRDYWLEGGRTPGVRSRFGRFLVRAAADVRRAAGLGPTIRATVFLSPSGDDERPCSRAAPCRSFQRGYQLARPGQVVELAAGDYGPQVMRSDPKKASASDVVLRPAPGGVVTVQGLRLGTVEEAGSGPSHLTILDVRDARRPQGAFTIVGVTDVTLENADAANFYIDLSTNVTIRGGDWGPCTVPSSTCSNSKIDTGAGHEILVEKARFHDYRIVPDSGEHFECMIVFGGRDITIRNNTFTDCEFYNIFVQHPAWAGYAGPDGTWPRDITIAYNTFTPVWENGVYGRRFGALAFSPRNVPFHNVRVTCNTFKDGAHLEVNDDHDGTRYENFTVVPHKSKRC